MLFRSTPTLPPLSNNPPSQPTVEAAMTATAAAEMAMALAAAAATGPRRHRVDGMFFHFIYLLHEYGWGPGTNGGSRHVAS